LLEVLARVGPEAERVRALFQQPALGLLDEAVAHGGRVGGGPEVTAERDVARVVAQRGDERGLPDATRSPLGRRLRLSEQLGEPLERRDLVLRRGPVDLGDRPGRAEGELALRGVEASPPPVGEQLARAPQHSPEIERLRHGLSLEAASLTALPYGGGPVSI